MLIKEDMFKKERTYARARRCEEDQSTKISSTLVAECTSSVNQSSDTVCLDSGADESRAVAGSSSGGFSRLEELLLAIGGLGSVVGVTEDGGKDSG